jgi:hypothetical protein
MPKLKPKSRQVRRKPRPAKPAAKAKPVRKAYSTSDN